MNKFIPLSFFIVFFATASFAVALTPTEKYLTQISEEEIAQFIQEDVLDTGTSFDFNQYADFFHGIIAQENEFLIGYHASTTDHLIFQEFVRVAMEEIHGWDVPEDFYFLRAPWDHAYDFEGTQEIFKKYGRPEFTPKELKKVVFHLVDSPLHHLSGHHLNWQKMSNKKVERLYFLLLHFTLFMPNTELTREEAAIELKKTLQKMIPSTLSSKHQEKLRKGIEAFIADPFEDEFRELNPDWLPFQSINCPFDDSDEELQKLVIALNVPLYGNFSLSSESTLHIFAKNRSVEVSDDFEYFFARAPNDFFMGIDMDSKAVKDLLAWAKKHLTTETGTILQFFWEPSELAPELDNLLYPCGFWGAPCLGKSVKEVITDGKGEWEFWPHFNQKLLVNQQVRLVLTNRHSLNPKGGLKIREYDLIDPALKKELRSRIREVMRCNS